MKYIQAYDEIWDECFQCEISEEFAEKIVMSGGHVVEGVNIISDTPLPNVPIMSRFRSDRHPEWNDGSLPSDSGRA